eukprot:scaffold92360_cov28-Tisochrysis_lutea.AAC.3
MEKGRAGPSAASEGAPQRAHLAEEACNDGRHLDRPRAFVPHHDCRRRRRQPDREEELLRPELGGGGGRIAR